MEIVCFAFNVEEFFRLDGAEEEADCFGLVVALARLRRTECLARALRFLGSGGALDEGASSSGCTMDVGEGPLADAATGLKDVGLRCGAPTEDDGREVLIDFFTGDSPPLDGVACRIALLLDNDDACSYDSRRLPMGDVSPCGRLAAATTEA